MRHLIRVNENGIIFSRPHPTSFSKPLLPHHASPAHVALSSTSSKLFLSLGKMTFHAFRKGLVRKYVLQIVFQIPDSAVVNDTFF